MLFIHKLACRQLPEIPFSKIVTFCYANYKLQVSTREFKSHLSRACWRELSLTYHFSIEPILVKNKYQRINCDLNRALAILKNRMFLD